jgi:hypothetical protein
MLLASLEMVSGEEPNESFAAGVWRELAIRHSLYKQPRFSVEDRIIEPNPTELPNETYAFCLLLSLFGVQGSTTVPSRLFERLSCEVVRVYLSGKAIVFGWPFEAGEDIDDAKLTLLGQKIKGVADELKEKCMDFPPPHFKDRGLDVVGWIPCEEGRSGQLVILMQCAAGHDWINKLPVPLDSWKQYIHWATDPVRAFSVPCIVDARDWHERSRDKGLLFDRIRIMNLLSNTMLDSELQDQLSHWINGQLEALDN